MTERSVTVFARGFKFPEGPAFDRNGNLFVVNIGTGDISKISPEGGVKTFVNTGGGPMELNSMQTGISTLLTGRKESSPFHRREDAGDRGITIRGRSFMARMTSSLIPGGISILRTLMDPLRKTLRACLSVFGLRRIDLPGFGIGLSQRPVYPGMNGFCL